MITIGDQQKLWDERAIPILMARKWMATVMSVTSACAHV